MKAYMCAVCGAVYEEEKGDPLNHIPPLTRWEDLPESWCCPDCGAEKVDFDQVDI